MRDPSAARRVMASWAVTIAIAALYLGWVGASRFLAKRSFEQGIRNARPPVSPVPDYGAGVKILQFYANAFEITAGERAILCYGVANARSVRLVPPVEKLTPKLNRCFWIQPSRTTTYKLVAEGADGTEVAETFTVQVRPAPPPPPSILFVTLSAGEIRRGEPLVLCYGVEHAAGVRLEPLGLQLPPSEKHCVRIFPIHTTGYTLVAAGSQGRTDREKFTITVK